MIFTPVSSNLDPLPMTDGNSMVSVEATPKALAFSSHSGSIGLGPRSLRSPPRSAAASARMARSIRSVSTSVVVIAATDTTIASANSVNCPLTNSRHRRRSAIMRRPRSMSRLPGLRFADIDSPSAHRVSLKSMLCRFPDSIQIRVQRPIRPFFGLSCQWDHQQTTMQVRSQRPEPRQLAAVLLLTACAVDDGFAYSNRRVLATSSRVVSPAPQTCRLTLTVTSRFQPLLTLGVVENFGRQTRFVRAEPLRADLQRGH